MKHKLITPFLIIFVLSLLAFSIIQLTRGQAKAPQDSVKISLSSIDNQIQSLTQQLKTLNDNITEAEKNTAQAKQNSIYLQGALDQLKNQRQLFTPDTTKAKVKK
jgi:peptidoglycan hydrolase CwlO-like protein